MISCGLDFGTSNSSIGVMHGAEPVLVPVESEMALMPSAVFVSELAGERVQFGSEAIATYLDQEPGRLMRALKSILGSHLIDEGTRSAAAWCRWRKSSGFSSAPEGDGGIRRAGDHAVVHGRPVRFVDDDDTADARAQEGSRPSPGGSGFRESRSSMSRSRPPITMNSTVERKSWC